MRVLVAAFACAPNVGSEPGVAWRWIAELARTNSVTVITDITRKAQIEASQQMFANPINFRYVRSRVFQRVALSSRTAHLIYYFWNISAAFEARRLHRSQPFDLAIHCTYGVFRNPSFLGLIVPKFIFGPVGGGEDVSWRLKRSLPLRDQVAELARAVANFVARFDPFLWLTCASAYRILTKTEETKRALPLPFRGRAMVRGEIGVDVRERTMPPARPSTEPLRVLFVGRLVGWKGCHLAVRAVALARAKGAKIHLTVVGRGRCEQWLRQLATKIDLADTTWIPHIPQEHLWRTYQQTHCFLFPSLHDSSGNVVLEAQSFGLPVVCLDAGGPPTLVSKRSAVIVETKDLTECALVEQLATALCGLESSESMRYQMGLAALEHVAEHMSWRTRVARALEGI